MMTVKNKNSNKKVSYRNALKFSREMTFRNRHNVKIGYTNKQKKYDDYVAGMESKKFDDVLDKDINFYTNRYSNYYNSSKFESKPSGNVETIRRLKLIKIAKQLDLDRNIYFNLFQKSYDGYNYSNKYPNNLEEFEIRRLFSRQRYIQFLNKSLLVNDIRDKVFFKISQHLNISQENINNVKFKTQHLETATSSSNAILSHSGSRDQERVKDIRLRENRNFEKYQHNSKWIVFDKKIQSESNNVYQLPKMNGKYHTEFCLKYFIANTICEKDKHLNSLYTTENILNMLLDIREHYKEDFLKVLKDNVINVFEGLSYDMQCLLSPSLDNIKNVDKANAIKKIINLGISRKEKLEKLYSFTYVNKFNEVIIPFDTNKKYRIIINSSYHYVKDTNLKPSPENPNCIANDFLSKFKISFGIYEVSDSFLLFDDFSKIKKKEQLTEITNHMCDLISDNYLFKGNFKDAIFLIKSIKNDSFSLNNFSPVTLWFRQYLELSPVSLSLYANMFIETQTTMTENYKKYKKMFKSITNNEISLKKKIVNEFLKNKQCWNKKNLINNILENNLTYGEKFQKHVIDFLEVLNNISINFMKQYLEIYVKMILNTSDVEGYLLFNHMIQRFIYFIDTKCYTYEFNIKFQQSNISKIHAFPMYSRSFNQILRKKKFKPSDCLKIYQINCDKHINNLTTNVKDEDTNSSDEDDDEMEFELSISEDEDEDEDEDEN
jgi:hypothetical protein